MCFKLMKSQEPFQQLLRTHNDIVMRDVVTPVCAPLPCGSNSSRICCSVTSAGRSPAHKCRVARRGSPRLLLFDLLLSLLLRLPLLLSLLRLRVRSRLRSPPARGDAPCPCSALPSFSRCASISDCMAGFASAANANQRLGIFVEAFLLFGCARTVKKSPIWASRTK